jgi:hypothetical protein
MPDSIPCPQFGAPVRITGRFWLDSTDGPVEHLKTGCVSKHWLTLEPRRSSRRRSPPRIATWRPDRSDRTRRCRRPTPAAPEPAPEQDGRR